MDSHWSPYSSKTEFLLDTIDNLPRMPISDSLMKLFLWVLTEAGVHDVPSFYRLRKIQKELREASGVPTLRCDSVQGNIFFLNDPRRVIAQDWSNPAIRPHIQVYPEIAKDYVSEVWHGDKWLNSVDLDVLSPMYDAGEKHYYVNELTQLCDGRFVVPLRWVVYQSTVHAQSRIVNFDREGFAFIDSTGDPVLISVDTMIKNYYDLQTNEEIPVWCESSYAYAVAMPNPLREIANGDPLYTSFVDYFEDDVSGNRSKSWNKHLNGYMAHRNLPRSLLQQEYHIHFVSTSTHATIAEQFTGFKNLIETTHTAPVRVQDSSNGRGVRFRMFVNADPSDNPMQSEVASHIGGGGNLFCRKCDAGGTNEEKESVAGFERLFKPGKPRSKSDIINSLQAQVKLACAGVAQPVKDLQTATGVKDIYTQYWIESLLERAKTMRKDDPSRAREDIERELLDWVAAHSKDIYSGFLTLKGFDPTVDTPIEILHTLLLGLVKYGWHMTHTGWSSTQKEVYAHRLQATNIDGLSIYPIRASYILQFANSLIGRQLKTLAQTTLFHVHDLVSPIQFRLWHAIGELSALLWIPMIYDMNTYLDDVDIAVGNVLDTFAEIDPTKILQKIKLHLQVHARADILRFGPLVGVSTEGFESFNAVFRFCSIFSNHRAPSRDIALQFAEQESMKHRLTGGWWSTDGGNTWTNAGSGVRDTILNQPVLQRLVGWSVPKPVFHRRPGSATLKPLPKGVREREPVMLTFTKVSQTLNASSYVRPNATCFAGRSFIAQSKDECTVDSWVMVPSPIDRTNLIGQVIEILVTSSTSSSKCLVVLDIFHLASTRHDIYRMPYLQRRLGEVSTVTVAAEDVLFKFNAQHDCLHAGCQVSGQRAQVQERIETSRTSSYVEHAHNAQTDRFIVNMHAFHNAHLIRQAIPRFLSAPIPYNSDRARKHEEISTDLRRMQQAK
ncbi:hypothetical protein BDY19DRAFT_901079, partial [Irpex rosettiformis]